VTSRGASQARASNEGSRIRLEVDVILFGGEELVGFVSALQDGVGGAASPLRW
jgi:hypothetical protein